MAQKKSKPIEKLKKNQRPLKLYFKKPNERDMKEKENLRCCYCAVRQVGQGESE